MSNKCSRLDPGLHPSYLSDGFVAQLSRLLTDLVLNHSTILNPAWREGKYAISYLVLGWLKRFVKDVGWVPQRKNKKIKQKKFRMRGGTWSESKGLNHRFAIYACLTKIYDGFINIIAIILFTI